MDPITRFKKYLKKAEKAKLPLPNAVCLATVGKNGTPSARMMLLKGADERGFVFYTNLKSRKGEELLENSHAALCFWWPQLEEQVRVEGKVEPVSGKEADAYFATRPRGSQIGAWASSQSAPLSSRASLLADVVKIGLRYTARKIPRPPHWSGFRLIPDRIEFWRNRPDRLHVRESYTRRGSLWHKQLLYP